MKNLIIIALLVFAGVKGWQKFSGSGSDSVAPLYQQSYVAVYGRNNCGYTRQMLSALKSSSTHYKYFQVDDRQVADQLHSRMTDSGISTRRYNLPVVDVNGQISVRPKPDSVLASYRAQL